MSVTWFSEPEAPMGGIGGEGVKRQLGRPTLDRLTVLVREAAQNSWDAAAPSGSRPVHFSIDLCDLSVEIASAWRRILEEGAPSSEHLSLRPTLERPELSVLFVSDRGTTGLGGPTRANQIVPGEPHDYVSFFLKVGDGRDKDFGGGTYGYGKAVFYRASTASTIVVYTRCTTESGEDETRLIGCALGPAFHVDGCSHTGRHWFGVPAGDGIVEPIRGEAADRMAAELGFPAFGKEEWGTTIAVLAPKLDGRPDEQSMRLVADSILWHVWPKMVVRDNGAPAMTFSVTHNDVPVAIPDPAEHAALRVFAQALADLDESGETITYGPGATPIGKISLRTTFDPPPLIDEVGEAAGLGSGVRHCCLLRVPELVVEYRSGPPLPDERIWYAGVFRVLPEQDETFASAEPPTHDAWSPEDLDSLERSIVRTTLRKIDDRLKRHASPAGFDGDGRGSGEGLAAVSRFLGSLLAPAPGQAAGARTGERAGTRGWHSVRMIGAPRWDKHDGSDVLIQEFEVDAGRTVTVDAETSVRVWGGGGKETAPPLGATEPSLVGWRAPDGTFHPPGRIAVPRGEGGHWQAIVRTPPDTAARIRVREAKTGSGDG
jgi:hypothetical protein